MTHERAHFPGYVNSLAALNALTRGNGALGAGGVGTNVGKF
jgi:hypothetical protein